MLDSAATVTADIETGPVPATWPWPQSKQGRTCSWEVIDDEPKVGSIGEGVTITDMHPGFGPLLQTLNTLLLLPENWDSYGARPIDPRLALYSLSLFGELSRQRTPLPSIVPTSQGGVQLEWHTRGIDLEVRIESLSLIQVYYEDNRTNESWEGDLVTTDLALLDRFIAEISRRP